MENIIKASIAIGGGIASFLFGGWSQALQALLLFIAVDYITGVIAAGKEGKLSSDAGLKGIARKVMIFFVVAVAHQVDLLLGYGHVFRDAAVTFYVVNEAISILENAGRMGVPIPDRIQQAIEILKGKEKVKK